MAAKRRSRQPRSQPNPAQLSLFPSLLPAFVRDGLIESISFNPPQVIDSRLLDQVIADAETHCMAAPQSDLFEAVQLVEVLELVNQVIQAYDEWRESSTAKASLPAPAGRGEINSLLHLRAILRDRLLASLKAESPTPPHSK